MRSAFFPQHQQSLPQHQQPQEQHNATAALTGVTWTPSPSKAASTGRTSSPRGTTAVPGSIVSSRAVRFPSSRRYLWDRTAAGPQVLIDLLDYLPRVQVAVSTFGAISRAAKHGAGGNTLQLQLSLAVTSTHQVTALIQEHDPLGSQAGWQLPCVLTDHGAHAADAATPQGSNLRDVLQSQADQRDIARLQQMYALSASASSAASPEGASSSLRLQLLMPASGLLATPLYTKRLVHVPLAEALLKPGCMAPGQTGYLSMDQARSLLPLEATDANVYSTPLVGVWVKGPTSVMHPLVVVACVRFVANSLLMDRSVNPEHGSFLLLLCPEGDPVSKCFEISLTDSSQLQLAAYSLEATLCPAASLAQYPGGLVPVEWVAEQRMVAPLPGPLVAAGPAAAAAARGTGMAGATVAASRGAGQGAAVHSGTRSSSTGSSMLALPGPVAAAGGGCACSPLPAGVRTAHATAGALLPAERSSAPSTTYTHHLHSSGHQQQHQQQEAARRSLPLTYPHHGAYDNATLGLRGGCGGAAAAGTSSWGWGDTNAGWAASERPWVGAAGEGPAAAAAAAGLLSASRLSGDGGGADAAPGSLQAGSAGDGPEPRARAPAMPYMASSTSKAQQLRQPLHAGSSPVQADCTYQRQQQQWVQLGEQLLHPPPQEPPPPAGADGADSDFGAFGEASAPPLPATAAGAQACSGSQATVSAAPPAAGGAAGTSLPCASNSPTKHTRQHYQQQQQPLSWSEQQQQVLRGSLDDAVDALRHSQASLAAATEAARGGEGSRQGSPTKQQLLLQQQQQQQQPASPVQSAGLSRLGQQQQQHTHQRQQQQQPDGDVDSNCSPRMGSPVRASMHKKASMLAAAAAATAAGAAASGTGTGGASPQPHSSWSPHHAGQHQQQEEGGQGSRAASPAVQAGVALSNLSLLQHLSSGQLQQALHDMPEAGGGPSSSYGQRNPSWQPPPAAPAAAAGAGVAAAMAAAAAGACSPRPPGAPAVVSQALRRSLDASSTAAAALAAASAAMQRVPASPYGHSLGVQRYAADTAAMHGTWSSIPTPTTARAATAATGVPSPGYQWQPPGLAGDGIGDHQQQQQQRLPAAWSLGAAYGSTAGSSPAATHWQQQQQQQVSSVSPQPLLASPGGWPPGSAVGVSGDPVALALQEEVDRLRQELQQLQRHLRMAGMAVIEAGVSVAPAPAATSPVLPAAAMLPVQRGTAGSCTATGATHSPAGSMAAAHGQAAQPHAAPQSATAGGALAAAAAAAATQGGVVPAVQTVSGGAAWHDDSSSGPGVQQPATAAGEGTATTVQPVAAVAHPAAGPLPPAVPVGAERTADGVGQHATEAAGLAAGAAAAYSQPPQQPQQHQPVAQETEAEAVQRRRRKLDFGSSCGLDGSSSCSSSDGGSSRCQSGPQVQSAAVQEPCSATFEGAGPSAAVLPAAAAATAMAADTARDGDSVGCAQRRGGAAAAGADTSTNGRRGVIKDAAAAGDCDDDGTTLPALPAAQCDSPIEARCAARARASSTTTAVPAHAAPAAATPGPLASNHHAAGGLRESLRNSTGSSSGGGGAGAAVYGFGAVRSSLGAPALVEVVRTRVLDLSDDSDSDEWEERLMTKYGLA